MNHLSGFLLVFGLLTTIPLHSQFALEDYLPGSVTYNPSIPKPVDVLGFEVGEWHVSHDKLVYYMRELAKASDRITLEEYAKSYEARPLLVLTITSSKNQRDIESIRQQHVNLSDPSKSAQLSTNQMPGVVYMGYSVHGNESSGANAALLVAYYLAAGQGAAIDELLANVVILLDPCMNPDGLNRFANWVNSNKSKNLDPSSDSREHNEVWPRGRTNHYWFDLNRDWLPVQLPESQGRINIFHKWKPNVLTDHHEMGTNSTYFFQPGIPARTNPLTPDKNQQLTGKIATYHAKALDKIGSLYYSKESFDDFYFGKGSTYPDANGCIGILFEQASSRGHLQESIHGNLTFPFTIQNQFETSLSTLKATQEMRIELLDYQRDFYRKGIEEAKRDRTKGYLVTAGDDETRLHHFVELLYQHKIKAYQINKEVSLNGVVYPKKKSYLIPLEQQQYRLIKAMFDHPTTFKDSLFYDVSGWTLPYAFNLDVASLDQLEKGEPFSGRTSVPSKSVVGGQSDYAYMFDWGSYYSPKLLNNILSKGILAKVSNKEIVTGQINQKFARGAIMIPAKQEGISKQALFQFLEEQAAISGVAIYSLKTGLSEKGIDLGSPSFAALKSPKILLITGDGVNGYDAGEVWHLLDQRFSIPLTLVETNRLAFTKLEPYNIIIMVDGSYSTINESTTAKIKTWIKNGGNLITFKKGTKWAIKTGLTHTEYKKKEKNTDQKRPDSKPYYNLGNERGAQYIGGAIFESKLDLSHPLCFGYTKEKLPVFHRGTGFFELPRNAYASPIRYTEQPLMSGYISDKNMQLLKNSAVTVVSKYGNGRIISLAINPNFRAFWYGTTPLFTNAIFFGHTISSSACEWPKPLKKND